MHPIQIEFENYVQAQEYGKADLLIESLLYDNKITLIERKDALQLLYRIGYVYPELTLSICKQRSDIPKPFIDTLNIAIGNTPPLRFYSKADSLIAIKIALIRNKPLVAKLLTYRFYRQFNLTPINLVKKNRLTIGNNQKKLAKKPNPTKVSVIITTFNSEKFIDNCIKSLLNQTLDNVEIIVVDDASTDSTIKAIKSYTNVKLIRLKQNRGTYFARNIGIKHATGELITFQDSDDWSHPERLEHQLIQITNSETTVANLSYFFRVDETFGLPTCRQNYPLLRLNPSSMMIHTEHLKNLNGFRDDKRVESDSLLLEDIKSYHGHDSINYIKSPLAIGRLRNDSLTTSKDTGFNRYGFSSHRVLS